MGSCLTKPPVNLEANVKADGNSCCNGESCPSSCCLNFSFCIINKKHHKKHHHKKDSKEKSFEKREKDLNNEIY